MRYFLPALALLLFSCGKDSIQGIGVETALNFTDATVVILSIQGLGAPQQPVRTSLSYYQMVPGWTPRDKDKEVFIQGDTTLKFVIQPQHPYKATARIGGYAIPFFIAPKDSLQIRVDVEKIGSLPEAVHVNLHQAETAYLLKKAAVLGNHSMKIYPILDRETNLATVAKSLDSLVAIESRFFRAYQDSAALPPYFKKLEENEIYYGNAKDKLYAEGYITGYLEQEAHVSPDYYSFIDPVNTQGREASFSPNYFDYLDLLAYHYWKDSIQHLEKAERFEILLPNAIALYDSLLSPSVANVAKARYLSRTATRLYSQLQEPIDKHINNLTDKSLRQYTHAFNQQYGMKLKAGNKAPDFYLLNEKEKVYHRDSFQDSLVYISFWATWCKPCIEEFPYENALVEKFKDKPVKIVSICLDSEREKWLKSIEQHGLKTLNLYAEGNWNERLKEKYATISYPHYVLLGKQGTIIQNKTLRPSEKADSLISHYLAL
jgi:thiol-disulfide isomerase/thioredoxin